MPLTVVSVAYPLAPVGPDATGGAEQVLTMLDDSLVRAGHRSIVIACEGSVCRGELVSTGRPAAPLDGEAPRAQRRTAAALAEVLARRDVDVVHLHGLDFHAYLPPRHVPTVVTLHLPFSFYPPALAALERPRTVLCAVSESQRRTAPPGLACAVVENGVPLARWRAVRKRGWAIALGRICPEKGFHLALDAAAQAGVPILLAGAVFPYPAHEAYFRREIAPRLGPRARYLGPVGGARKRRLLAAARCLVVPSLVAETSSLVAMEALACGTPVVALRAGALPEIVEHGRTGLVVDGADGLAGAIAAVAALEPRACRAAAESRFDAAGMARRYLDLYARVAGEAQRGARADA